MSVSVGFYPGVAPTGNAYPTWAQALAQAKKRWAASVPGVVSIFVDDSAGAAHATGVTSCTSLELAVNFNTAGSATLHVDNGATLTASSVVVDGGLILRQDGASPWWTVANGNFASFTLRGRETVASSSTATPLIRYSSAAAFFEVVVADAAILGDGVHPVITADVGTTVSIDVQDLGTLQPNALAGAGNFNVQVTGGGRASATQPGVTGTVTITYLNAPAQSYFVDLAGADLTVNNVTATILTKAIPVRAGRTALRLAFSVSGQQNAVIGTIRFRVKLDGTYVTGLCFTPASGGLFAAECEKTLAASAAGHTVIVEADSDNAAGPFYVFTSGAATPIPGGVTSPAYPMQAALTVDEAAL